MKLKKLFLLPFILFLFLSIGLMLFLGGKYVMNLFKTKPNLVVGFPQEASPARDQFLLQRSLKSYQIPIGEDNDVSYFARFSGESSNLQYYAYPNQRLEGFLQSAAESPEGRTMHLNLAEELGLGMQEYPIDGSDIGFPTVNIENQNTIHIETEHGKEQFPVRELFESVTVSEGNISSVFIPHASDESFLMYVSFTDGGTSEEFYVFMQKDFSDFITVTSDEYIQSISSQKLPSYKELVFGEALNERFVLINGVDGVYDNKKEEVRMVDDKDRMSIDGKFVYLQGREKKLKSGKQKIQRTEDYFSNNRKMYSTFELEKGEISKQLDFRAFGFQGDVTLRYFAEDYMIYTYSYKGFLTGTAGRTNVIVDLQEDTVNPTYYLGEFGLRTTLEAKP